MRRYLLAVGAVVLLVVVGLLLDDLVGWSVFGWVVLVGVIGLVAIYYFGSCVADE